MRKILERLGLCKKKDLEDKVLLADMIIAAYLAGDPWAMSTYIAEYEKV